MAIDSLVTGLAAAGAVVTAAWFQRTGNNRDKKPADQQGVLLQKIIDDRVNDLKARVAELETECTAERTDKEHVIAERDQLFHENVYLNQRNRELGGP